MAILSARTKVREAVQTNGADACIERGNRRICDVILGKALVNGSEV